MSKPPYRFFNLALGVLVVAGAVLLFEFLAPRSEVENQFLFGLSLRRFILGAMFVFFWIINLIVLILQTLKPASLQTWAEAKAHILVPWGLSLLYLTALGAITIWVAMLPPMLISSARLSFLSTDQIWWCLLNYSGYYTKIILKNSLKCSKMLENVTLRLIMAKN